MNCRMSLLCMSACLTLTACSVEGGKEPAITEQATERYSADVEQILNERAVVSLAIRQLSEKDRRAICDGLQTNIQTYDFCTDTVPKDWKPLEFNGVTYYVIPLAGDD